MGPQRIARSKAPRRLDQSLDLRSRIDVGFRANGSRKQAMGRDLGVGQGCTKMSEEPSCETQPLRAPGRAAIDRRAGPFECQLGAKGLAMAVLLDEADILAKQTLLGM